MKNLRLSINNSIYELEIDKNNFKEKLLDTLYVFYYQYNTIYFKDINNLNTLQEIIDHSRFIIIFGNKSSMIEYFERIIRND